MPITISRLKPDEWKEWKKIRLESLALHPESFASSMEDEAALPDEDFKKRIENNALFGAWESGELIGTIGFFILKSPKMCHRGNMYGMYVKKDFRGKGVSARLLEVLIAYAEEHVLQLHCSVAVENIAAVKLYERHGFTVYGTEPRSIKIESKYYDKYYMALSFD